MKKPVKMVDDRKLMDRLAPDPSLGRLLGLFATTYEMQPEFFETDFLPTLLGLGAWDDRSWSSRIALEKQLSELDAAAVLFDTRPYRGRPRSLRVEAKPVSIGAGRILHAKIVIGIYDEAVRLIIGSANLTEPGYRRNREVVAVLTASAKRPADTELIENAIREMPPLFDPWTSPATRQLLDLALQRLGEWLPTPSNSEQWVAWGGGERALWQQYIESWPQTDQVQRITVVSPFWSEERVDGPITTFVTAISKLGCLAQNAKLLMLTEAAPDKEATFKPRLPTSFGDFDARSLGLEALALAVDPGVPPEEVGLGEEFTGTRNLHAKVLLLEGSETSLAYLGSANFTRHGWGFLPDPRRANIEAGLIVRRSGASRDLLRSLIPSTTGEAVPLAGAAAGRLALQVGVPDESPWPTFLRDVLLAQSETDAEQLDLVVVITDEVAGSWTISHLVPDGASKQVLLSVDQPEPGKLRYRVPLSTDGLGRLLREQEVHVEWWLHPEGRSFPINVEASARMGLPISPGTGLPEEQQLIAYYQGQITWEDLYPAPESDPVPGKNTQDVDGSSSVDTSRIQSYIVREFVEALKGISDDLKAAAQSPKTCMRLALLGSVSPVALAKRVVEAADAGERTPTACGFQLVEILGCLDAARQLEASARFAADWREFVDEAAARVASMLENLLERFPEQLSSDFRRYARKVRQHHLQKVNKQ